MFRKKRYVVRALKLHDTQIGVVMWKPWDVQSQAWVGATSSERRSEVSTYVRALNKEWAVRPMVLGLRMRRNPTLLVRGRSTPLGQSPLRPLPQGLKPMIDLRKHASPHHPKGWCMCGCDRCVTLVSGSCQCRGCECNTVPLVHIEHPEYMHQPPPVYSGPNQAFAPETPSVIAMVTAHLTARARGPIDEVRTPQATPERDCP